MHQIASPYRNALTAIAERWQRWKDRRVDVLELDSCEVERIAADLGMSTAELRRATANGPDAARELHDRLVALHLEQEASADRLVKRDLERVCSLCDSKRRCRSDLAQESVSVQDAYCPNRDTLMGLAMASLARKTS
jgi:hypothetical protein